MAKRIIGLHVGREHVHAVQLSGRAVSPRIDAAVTMPLEGADPAAVVREINGTGRFTRGTAVVSCLPGAHSFVRDCHTVLEDPEHIRRTLRFELEADLPMDPAELVLDIIGLTAAEDGRRVHVGAVRRTELEAHIQAIADAGLKPHTVGLESTALLRAVRAARSEGLSAATMVIYLEPGGANLVLARPHQPPTVRHVEFTGGVDAVALRREVALTWQAACHRRVDDSTPVLVVGALAPEGLPGKVEQLTPPAGVTAEQMVAAGLAQRGLAGTEGPDFLAVHRAESKRRRGFGIEIGVAAALLLILGGVLTVGIWRELQRLEARNAELKERAEEIFRETVPGVTRIVDAQTQMATQLKELQAQYALLADELPGRWSAANILHAVSATVPKDGKTTIREVRIQGGQAQITGITDSFGTVDVLKDAFAAIDGVRTVEDRNLSIDTGKRHVSFELLVTFGPEVPE